MDDMTDEQQKFYDALRAAIAGAVLADLSDPDIEWILLKVSGGFSRPQRKS